MTVTIFLSTCDIGVESIATWVQEMLIDCFRVTYNNNVVDIVRDFWTDERGRECLAHNCYGG